MFNMAHHSADAARAAVFPVIQKYGAVINSHHPSALRHGTDHLIRQVPGMPCYCPGIRMAGRKRLLHNLSHVPESGIPEMRHIHRHSDFLHQLNKFDSLFLKSMLRLRHRYSRVHIHLIWIGQIIFIIPGQSHHSDSFAVKIPKHVRTAVADSALFDRKHA